MAYALVILVLDIVLAGLVLYALWWCAHDVRAWLRRRRVDRWSKAWQFEQASHLRIVEEERRGA